ncbi:caspase family protein [Novosphingobium sp. 9U]|uniref:caspase family protein n=1 Tax=Novosphingobium sp. 9U TaxID=2653158 RepID=UPI0012F24498|nr:caspase family protein [Novosphingobium sp. 9U]VWX54515.1 conserved hypothetical protein [Novosphingobium sp. 9U]
MVNACIAIGIERTGGPGLGKLPGAVNGARAMAAWAKAAGYQVELVTDRDDVPGSEGKDTFTPVDVGRIKAALMRLLPTANDGVDRGGPAEPPQRLLVYFAGHGMQSAADGEMWLLSDSYSDQLAIGLAKLQALLQTYLTGEKPGQIAIISDACRSPMIATWNVNMTPVPVVPLGPYDPNSFDQVDIDQFLAVPPLSSAFMVRATAEAPARCIFTSVLLEALHGAGESCFEDDRVTSDSMAKYLRETVPSRARQFDVDMRPRVYPCWIDPNDVYVSREQLAKMQLSPLDPWPGTGATSGQGSDDAQSEALLKSFGAPSGLVRGEDRGASIGADAAAFEFDAAEPPPEPEPEPAPPSPIMTDSEMAQIATEADMAAKTAEARATRAAALVQAATQTQRATHYETQCGLTVTGLQVTGVACASGYRFEADGHFPGSWRVSGPDGPLQDGQSAWALVRVPSGDSVATCVQAGSITSVCTAPEGALVASMRPLFLDPSKLLTSEDIQAHERLAVSDADDALQWLAQLEQGQVFDPMLGVLAAYVFYGAGQQEMVRRLAHVYAARLAPLPFDIALLCHAQATCGSDGTLMAQVSAVPARKPRSREQRLMAGLFAAAPQTELPVAGRVPLLRQGWFLLDRACPALVHPDLAALAPRLRPAPLTTLDPAGAEALTRILEYAA